MPISFACSGCGKALKTKDEMAGRQVKCPGCQAPLRIPAAPVPQAELDALLPDDPPAPKPARRPPTRAVPAAAPPRRPPTRSVPAAAPAPASDLDALLPDAPAVPEKAAPSRRPQARRAGEPMRPRAGGASTSDAHALMLGGVAGLVAAVVGASLWYLIAKGANAKIGWLAWGIGWACGFAVATLSGGKGGMLLPVLGAATALFGWLIGEYMLFSWHFPELLVKVMQDRTSKRLDPEAIEAIRAMARSVSFGTYLEKTCDWKDGMFVLLAVGTGWGVPQKMAA